MNNGYVVTELTVSDISKSDIFRTYMTNVSPFGQQLLYLPHMH